MAQAGLVLLLRSNGITDNRLLKQFESVPHQVFVPEEFAEYAYRDASLPIECGQSISSPLVLARMLCLLEPFEINKALEIGTGSGYSAALLSRFARRTFTIERYQTLIRAAEARWAQLKLSGIVGFHDDGLEGLAQQAPFDRILLTGSVTEVPETLTEQLADGGILVAAVGAADARQQLIRIVREDDELVTTEHAFVRLPQLTPGKARAL